MSDVRSRLVYNILGRLLTLFLLVQIVLLPHHTLKLSLGLNFGLYDKGNGSFGTRITARNKTSGKKESYRLELLKGVTMLFVME